MNLLEYFESLIGPLLVLEGGDNDVSAVVRQSTRIEFGDYQINGVMSVAKKIGVNPRELSKKIADQISDDPLLDKVEVAGPGFINLFLRKSWISQQVMKLDPVRLGIPELQEKQTIVVDYSAPNVAKEMHVGHLRSTLIGDSVVKVLEFVGHKVVRANHIGDWGTQFGMLIAHLEEIGVDGKTTSTKLSDLEEFYRESKQRYDQDAGFAERAREYVVKLQGGDEWCLSMWKSLVDITMEQNQYNYDRLNVSLTSEDAMGESVYNHMLQGIVDTLKDMGIAVESDGAIVVYLDEFKNKDNEPMGVIVQKKDGGFLYSTTDIACAKYRYETLGADRLLYFIDARQSQHLKQAWAIVRKANFVPDKVSIEHNFFGVMLGKDGKPFKTRAGGVVKMSVLLDEAERRAEKLINERDGGRSNLDDKNKPDVIKKISIASVKYADLSRNRTSDYVFDWDTMLSFEGNTAPYLMYAYSRIKSLFRKADVDIRALDGYKIRVDRPEERALGLTLLQFKEVLDVIVKDGSPHLLCSYLYKLAMEFMRFYESCAINKDGVDSALRDGRLGLCHRVACMLQKGLSLLGIETVEQM